MLGSFKAAVALGCTYGLALAAAAPTANSTSQTCTKTMDGQLPNPTPLGFTFSGTVRRYYIAAEEVEWDYAPTGWDNWLGVSEMTNS